MPEEDGKKDKLQKTTRQGGSSIDLLASSFRSLLRFFFKHNFLDFQAFYSLL